MIFRSKKSSSWAGEKLYQLINHRYNLRLPTVITANEDGLKALDARICSRLTDKALVQTVMMDQAEDYRPYNHTRTVQRKAITVNKKEAGRGGTAMVKS